MSKINGAVGKVLKHDIFNLAFGKYVSLGTQLLIILLITRYFGIYTLGVWGFTKLILQIVNYADLGLQFSIPVLLSQKSDDDRFMHGLFKTSLIVIFGICITLFILCLLIVAFDLQVFPK